MKCSVAEAVLQRHHAADERVDGWGEAAMLYVEVVAFAAPEIVETELGRIRLWYGNMITQP